MTQAYNPQGGRIVNVGSGVGLYIDEEKQKLMISGDHTWEKLIAIVETNVGYFLSKATLATYTIEDDKLHHNRFCSHIHVQGIRCYTRYALFSELKGNG